jgi:hypothetical protein
LRLEVPGGEATLGTTTPIYAATMVTDAWLAGTPTPPAAQPPLPPALPIVAGAPAAPLNVGGPGVPAAIGQQTAGASNGRGDTDFDFLAFKDEQPCWDGRRDLNQKKARALWSFLNSNVADRMKVFTRPFVPIMAGSKIGTGTFVQMEGVKVLTCEHVAECLPHAHHIDHDGSAEVKPGIWCVEPNIEVDAAFAPIEANEWSRISSGAQALPMSKFASRHSPVPYELLFFRGIAGENVGYISGLGADVILAGYCSQEKENSGNARAHQARRSCRL